MEKKALLFGYFTVSAADPTNIPGSKVFTCLSHDIIAHETSHALLDGVHPRFMEPTNVDVLALHEAFADIVAIFQRFANPTVLYHEIDRTNGDLSAENLMGKLAVQFGKAVGRGGALRDALGKKDEKGEWKPKKADPRELQRTMQPHARGAILVAAVFDAFLLIYRSRATDLLRIATQGTGILPDGAIHPDLVRRLANEAARSAQHVLQICIRALDYCQPIDVTFGGFLRAIITADHDLYPEDQFSYRVAVIDAFRRRGIFPPGIGGLSQDTLLWPTGTEALIDSGQVSPSARIPGLSSLNTDWDLESDREKVWEKMSRNAKVIREWLTKHQGKNYATAFGLTFDEDMPLSVYREKGVPAVEIFVRTALRRGYQESLVRDLVVEMTQWRHGFHDPKDQEEVDSGKRVMSPNERPDFKFRRGCTILIDPSDMTVRYVMRTAGTVADDNELERVRDFLTQEDPSPRNAFEAGPRDFWPDEDILELHRSYDEETSNG